MDKDFFMVSKEEWEEAKELFREDVLLGMDAAVKRILKSGIYIGSTNSDLPRLFKAIDEQFEIVMKRYGREKCCLS